MASEAQDPARFSSLNELTMVGRSLMSLCRRLATALVAAAFLISFSLSPLEAAAEQRPGSFRQRSRLMKDENLRARAMEKFALINPPGSIKVLITQLAAARQRAATFESGDERTARVRAIVPKLDRLLHLARILEASASERSTLLRQLPLAAGVLAARPKPADSSSSRRQKKSDMPDGSGGSRSAKADLCEDDEGWSECATDQDIEDGLIQYYATQADIESAESDLDQTGEVLEEYCNTHPEDCYVPQPLPISLESEVVGEPATGESSDSVHEMPTSCAGNPY